MILTGALIDEEVRAGRVVIDPFDARHLEPNSYGFHLGRRILTSDDLVADPRVPPRMTETIIPEDGLTLFPGRHYLGETHEQMGSDHYAATLYANRSTGCLGVWIQMSAPLGHTGAVIPWTLEIAVVHPTRVYAGMPIGKIAFWMPQGVIAGYSGKYADCSRVEASRISADRYLADARGAAE